MNIIKELILVVVEKLIIPKGKHIVVIDDKKEILIAEDGKSFIKYDNSMDVLIYDPKVNKATLTKKENEDCIVIPKPYFTDTSNAIHVGIFKDKLNEWSRENNMNLEWKVGPRDSYLCLYSKVIIEKFMKQFPKFYQHHYIDEVEPGWFEWSDCDDYAGGHFEYWIKRLLPGCAYAVVEGYVPGGHEFGVILTKENELMWISVGDPTHYKIIAVVRY